MNNIENGWGSDADITRVIDGDTIEVEVIRRFHIRLRDVDTPENNTLRGMKATNFVDRLLADNSDARIQIFIPSNQAEKLMDINSFSRLVGDIYIDGKLLQDILKAEGLTDN